MTPEREAQQTALDLARTLAGLGLPPADYRIGEDGRVVVFLDRRGITVEEVIADFDRWLRAVGATGRKRTDTDPAFYRRIAERHGFADRVTTTYRGVSVTVAVAAISIAASAPEGGA